MVLRVDTLRILMDSKVILDLNSEIYAAGWQPPEYCPGWSHRARSTSRYRRPLTKEATGLDGDMHGLIITEDTGMDLRAILIPITHEEWIGVKAMTISPTTWEPQGLEDDDGQYMGAFWLLFTQLATFLSADGTEIVPRPLTRSEQRRLARTGRPNPWHIIR